MKLFILGNGYDRAHDLPTRYQDFAKWLLTDGNDIHNTVDHIERILGPEAFDPDDEDMKWWYEFEAHLGETLVDEIISEYCEDFTPNYGSDDYHDADMYDVGENTRQDFEEAYDAIKKSFREWIEDIDRLAASPRFEYPANAIFINFNYTDTLENLYDIDPVRVLHIHGRASIPTDELILGHGKSYDDLIEELEPKHNFEEEDVDWLDGEEFHEEYARQEGARIVAERKKDIEGLLRQHATWLEKLRDVDEVEFLGHSYNDIDAPYFTRFLSMVKPSATIKASYHNDDDLDRMKSLMERIGIHSSRYTPFYS